MRRTFLFIVLCSLLLVSCRQKAGQPPVKYPSVIEITGTDSLISPEALKPIFQANHLEINAYQWKNHLLLYGLFPDLAEIQKQIEKVYPEPFVKVYEQPFYVFDQKNCKAKIQAAQWSHTIMSANLLADTVLQKEYMDYHARQAELFPEVAEGFCRAGFQQLLVFRNGRQLLLVIAIPGGESLDDLNPKTTENNPRMNEWNAIMANYQEGIEGTTPGETWITFNPVK
jgi:L-rhamnose mutarotase